jgi:hypothetical protein
MMASCAARSETWFTASRVKLNVCKSELLYTSTPNRSKLIEKLPLQVGDDLVQPSLVVKNLGVIFDSNLTMIPHINSVCKSAFFLHSHTGKNQEIPVTTCGENLGSSHGSIPTGLRQLAVRWSSKGTDPETPESPKRCCQIDCRSEEV